MAIAHRLPELGTWTGLLSPLTDLLPNMVQPAGLIHQLGVFWETVEQRTEKLLILSIIKAYLHEAMACCQCNFDNVEVIIYRGHGRYAWQSR